MFLSGAFEAWLQLPGWDQSLFLGNSWMMILDSWIPFLLPAVHSVLDTLMFAGSRTSPLPASH